MNLDELLKAAINDPTKRSVFLQTLIRSDVYVICRNPVKTGSKGEGVQMDLITIQNPEGALFIPFFTSHRALEQFAKRYVECYKLNCRQPQRSLSHITRAASKFFAEQPNVDRAFILEMTRGSEKPQILIIVDMIGNTRKLFVPLARTLSKSSKSGDHLCFLSYEQSIAKKAADGITPFYVRKKRFFEK